MHDVFISYSHKDKQIANMVLAILEQNRIKCWIDYRDAVPGDNYAASIVHAIKDCAFFILMLSRSSNESAHVVNEVNCAVNAGKIILPFKIDDAEISEDLEYYVSKTHWLDAITPPMEEHINQLADAIGKRAPQRERPRLSQDTRYTPFGKGCRMVRFQELLALGQSASSIAMQLVENDYINCNGIGEDNEGTAEQWEVFLQDNSETFQYLINEENKIVGDWSIVALTEEAYETAEKGELLEKDIGEENTDLICFPDVYHGYILSFSLLPEYRNMENYNLLSDSFFRQLEIYSENGIYFKHFCINVFGREVEAFIRRLGFKFVCNNKVFGKIFTCDFFPLPAIPLLKKYPRLVENYANQARI